MARRADDKLKKAANNALAKISSVLPAELRYQLESSGLLIGPVGIVPANDDYEALIRQAIRKEYKLQMSYIDLKGKNHNVLFGH